jgi:glycosyltransferase involved in cell wall biosynthesis
MKILLVHDYSAAIGGAENYVLNLNRALRESGHEVRFISSDVTHSGLPIDADYSFCGVEFQAQPWKRLVARTWNAKASHFFKKMVKDFQPDIIHLNTFSSQFSSSILRDFHGIPAVMTIHEYNLFCPFGSKFIMSEDAVCFLPWSRICVNKKCISKYTYLIHLFRKWILWHYRKNIALWLPPSSFTESYLKENGYTPIHRLPYGFPVEKYPFIPWEQRVKEPTVLFFARLEKNKGAAYLINAFVKVIASIPKARLVIAGTGPEENRLKDLCKKLQLEKSIDFLGWVSGSKIAGLHRNTHISVITSVGADNLPLTVCESMFYGTPVVGFRIGGIPDLLDNLEINCLVTPNSTEALSAKIVEMLNQPELLRTIGINLRESAVNMLGMEKHIEKLNSIYCQLLNKQP